MTAPAAPVIRAHSDGSGTRVIVRWQPVPNATDYDLYVNDGFVDGIEDQFEDTEVGTDGWFHVYTGPQSGPIEVYVKALNVLAEASVASNRKQVILRGDGNDNSTVPVAVMATLRNC